MNYFSTFLLSFFFILPYSCNCQTYVFKALLGKDVSKIEKELLANESVNSGIKGSAYLYDDYRVGYIFYQDSFYNFPQIKFNIFEQRIELIYHGRNKFLSQDKVSSFALINPFSNEIENYFNTNNIKFKETKEVGFVQKIKAKDYNIFVHHSVFIRKPTENASYLGETLEAKFINKTTCYLEQKNWLYLIKNHKDIAGVLDQGQRKRADQFISKNKLKFKKLEDYIELFTYLGTTRSSI